jgi:hypothetical protein
VYVEAVAPGIANPSFNHWYVRPPRVTTVNDALEPRVTVWLPGCPVIATLHVTLIMRAMLGTPSTITLRRLAPGARDGGRPHCGHCGEGGLILSVIGSSQKLPRGSESSGKTWSFKSDRTCTRG